jgi:hypothetical protein
VSQESVDVDPDPLFSGIFGFDHARQLVDVIRGGLVSALGLRLARAPSLRAASQSAIPFLCQLSRMEFM